MSIDSTKITQAMNYLAIRCGQRSVVNRLKALKLLFFADRYHLRKYGRPLSGDNYYAMEHGPVASLAKDITQDSDILNDTDQESVPKYIEPDGRHEYRSVTEADLSVFSQTDLEALEFVVANFGAFDKWVLRDMTHLFPEWYKFEELLKTSASRVDMHYVDFFDDPDETSAKFKKLFPNGDIFPRITNPHAKEIYLDQSNHEARWKV